MIDFVRYEEWCDRLNCVLLVRGPFGVGFEVCIQSAVHWKVRNCSKKNRG